MRLRPVGLSARASHTEYMKRYHLMLYEDRRYLRPDQAMSPGEYLIRQIRVNGEDSAASHEEHHDAEAADSEAMMAHERARGAAYAAVTAHLADDKQTVSDCVYDLIRDPVDAAGGFILLIIACGALAELWGRAIHEEPAKAWAMYAAAVAQGVSHYGIQAREPGA